MILKTKICLGPQPSSCLSHPQAVSVSRGGGVAGYRLPVRCNSGLGFVSSIISLIFLCSIPVSYLDSESVRVKIHIPKQTWLASLIAVVSCRNDLISLLMHLWRQEQSLYHSCTDTLKRF